MWILCKTFDGLRLLVYIRTSRVRSLIFSRCSIQNDTTGQATIRMNRQAVFYGEPVHSYRSESGFKVKIHPFTNKKCRNTMLNLCMTLTANTKKILDFRIGLEIGLIRCSKGDKLCNFVRNVIVCDLLCILTLNYCQHCNSIDMPVEGQPRCTEVVSKPGIQPRHGSPGSQDAVSGETWHAVEETLLLSRLLTISSTTALCWGFPLNKLLVTSVTTPAWANSCM